jgi:hypothetical protein
MDEDLTHAIVLTDNGSDALDKFPACEFPKIALKQGLAIDDPVTCLQCTTLIVQCDTIIDYKNSDLWRFYRTQLDRKLEVSIERRDEKARREKARREEEARWAKEDRERREKEAAEQAEVMRIVVERRKALMAMVFGTKDDVVRAYNGHAFVESGLPRTFCEVERRNVERLTPEKTAVLLRKATTNYNDIACMECRQIVRVRQEWLDSL